MSSTEAAMDILGARHKEGRGLARLSHKHLAILEMMLAHPTMPLWQVAQKAGVTQPWLSQIINSDLFRAALMEHGGEVRASLRERVEVVADMATEKLMMMLPTAQDIDSVANIQKNTLKALGYGAPLAGPGGQVNVQQNIYNVAPEDVLAAREKFRQVTQAARERDAEVKMLPSATPEGAVKTGEEDAEQEGAECLPRSDC